MMAKMLCVLLLTTMVVHYGQPAELASAAERVEWLKSDANPTSSQSENAKERNRGDNGIGKGILERSFRLRSRLNTHLLMLKFRR